ncbi:MAG: hypothetical protein V3V01_04510 [Acidimicrobiales bacterium]
MRILLCIPRRHRIRFGLLVILAGLIAASCSNTQQLTTSAASGESTVFPSVDLPTAFTDCADGDIGEDSIFGESVLLFAEEWLKVVDILDADRESQNGSHPAVILGSDGTKTTVRAFAEIWPGVDWALANGGDVWLALSSTTEASQRSRELLLDEGLPLDRALQLVVYPIATAADGTVFVPGGCGFTTVYQQLVNSRGAEGAIELLLSIRGQTGEALAELLRPPTPEPLDTPVLLHPGDVSDKLLDRLQSTLFHFSLSQPLEPGSTICTKVPAGWNDCFQARDALVGLPMDGYLDDSGEVEVWQFNEDADLARPVKKLGGFTIDASNRKPEEVAVRVVIDIGKESNQVVEVTKVIDLKDLEDGDGFEGWPGLFDPTVGLPEPSDSNRPDE